MNQLSGRAAKFIADRLNSQNSAVAPESTVVAPQSRRQSSVAPDPTVSTSNSGDQYATITDSPSDVSSEETSDKKTPPPKPPRPSAFASSVSMPNDEWTTSDAFASSKRMPDNDELTTTHAFASSKRMPDKDEWTTSDAFVSEGEGSKKENEPWRTAVRKLVISNENEPRRNAVRKLFISNEELSDSDNDSTEAADELPPPSRVSINPPMSIDNLVEIMINKTKLEKEILNMEKDFQINNLSYNIRNFTSNEILFLIDEKVAQIKRVYENDTTIDDSVDRLQHQLKFLRIKHQIKLLEEYVFEKNKKKDNLYKKYLEYHKEALLGVLQRQKEFFETAIHNPARYGKDTLIMLSREIEVIQNILKAKELREDTDFFLSPLDDHELRQDFTRSGNVKTKPSGGKRKTQRRKAKKTRKQRKAMKARKNKTMRR